MAESINVVSFDVDTKAALQSVDGYINSLNKLEKELVQLQKEGKDTTAVQLKMAAATAQLDKALQQETRTTRGAVAQNMALDRSLKSTVATTQKAAIQSEGLSKANTRGASSFARSVAGAKGLTSALARTAGSLGNLVGGFGVAGIAINIASDLVAKFIDKMFEASEADKKFAEFKEKASKAIAEENAVLNDSVAVLRLSASTQDQRTEAIARLNSLLPEYINNIDLLKASEEELNTVVEAGTFLILQRAIKDQFKDEKAAVSARLQGEELDRVKAIAKFTAEYRGELNNVETIEARGKAQDKLNAKIEAFDKQYVTRKAFIQQELDEIIKQEEALLEAQAAGDVQGNQAAVDLAILNQENAKKNAAIKDADAKRSKSRAKATKDENTLIAGTLAALEAELGKVNKALNEQTKITDTEKLAQLGAEYQRLTIEIDKAKKAIEDVTKAREADKVNVIKNAEIGDILAESQRINAERELATRKETVERIELARQLKLNRLEKERQGQLKIAQDANAQAVINATNAKKRVDVEKQANTDILNARLAVQEQLKDIAISNRENVAPIEAEIANLRAELLKLTGEDYTLKLKVDDDGVEEDWRERLKKIAGYIEQFSSIAFQFLNQQSAAQIAAADAAVDKQQSVLDALLANEDTANAEQVRLEQERLDKLNKEREKAKDREAKIAQAQIAINLALAVARAVAEGGGIASAITVAAALAAAVVGFVSAKQASSQAFFEGTLYAERAPSEPRGRDTINARINEGEAIIPTATNAQYSKAVAAIYNKSVPAAAMNNFVTNYSKLGADSYLRDAAKFNAAEYRLVGMARTDRAERTNAGMPKVSDNAEVKTMLSLFIAEMRKNKQQGNKRQSAADSKGMIRARLGVTKNR